MDTLGRLADAVVDTLNAEAFSLAFTASRKYIPAYTLEELAELTVTVVPSPDSPVSINRADRTTCYYDYKIEVGFEKQASPEDIDRCDSLVQLVGEVIDHLMRNPRLDVDRAVMVEPLVVKTYAEPKILNEQRVFVSVLVATYRTRR